ncbi:MAG: type II toxin-antitoxin system RelE/ParE family toxin [Alphaproteobacteria bacterium]|nr:type II toxin-antitoxin system RelE/ParE family toxin [Alphaproteobacteria bacterium]
MKILQAPKFEKTYKKLQANQRSDVDSAIRKIVENPMIGELKAGDLSHLRVYKFKMAKQLTLIAYQHEKDTLIIILIAVGPHENFYRDLKR